MGARIVTGDVLKVIHFCKFERQTALNVLHYKAITHAGTGATIEDCALAFDLAAGASYRSILAVGASYAGSGAQRVFPGAEIEMVFSGTTAGVGDNAGDTVPGQVCGILTKRTGLAGRKNRGRIYLPFPSELHNGGNGLPTAAYTTLLLGVVATLMGTYQGGGGGNTTDLTLHLLNKDGLAVVKPVTTLAIRSAWATQRRRGSYGQTNPSPV